MINGIVNLVGVGIQGLLIGLGGLVAEGLLILPSVDLCQWPQRFGLADD